MKRVFAIVLSFALILGLLPVLGYAGGGGAGQYWHEDFESASEFWSNWAVIDADGDGFGFNLYRESGGNYCVRSGEPLEMGSGGPTASDDYLISPPISLGAGQEYTLYYRMGGTAAATARIPTHEVYVYTGSAELTAANLYTELGGLASL